MQEKNTFTITHLSMSLKYGGISFIAGSVSHGVFSGQRSMLTALIGLLAFVLGTWLENRDNKTLKTNLIKTLAISSLLAVSLGFFTGSLQHFPDSPYRSVWVVPLGFALSLLALSLTYNKSLFGELKRYTLGSFAVVLMVSIGAYSYYSQNGSGSGHSHATASTSHDHTSSHDAHSLMGEVGKLSEITRSIEISMSDNMRFEPSQITVKAGETIRFIVKNVGKIRHELTLGSPEDLKQHAAMMLKNPDMQHDDPNMAQVEPGEKGEIIWKFGQHGTVDFACLQPGHYEAGMKGMVNVTN